MFTSLTDKFQTIFKEIRNKGKLNENDIKDCLHEIRIALLEADVNYKVVKEFINNLHEKMQQEKISESLTPAQQIIKIVNGEITLILGSKQNDLSISPAPPTIIMLVGCNPTNIIIVGGAGLILRSFCLDPNIKCREPAKLPQP